MLRKISLNHRMVLAWFVVAAMQGIALAATSPGDMNCDGVVNGTDIPLFVNCLINGNCNTGLVDCDGNTANGCETNTNTNVNNCGTCGHVCSLANATSICVNGVCTIGSCDPGFADCNSNPTDGCEVFMFGNPSHCNGCNTPCPTPPHATATCQMGICGFVCEGGWGNCDGNPANGCETNLITNFGNCGNCGVVCNFSNGNGACNAGACTLISCNTGFGNCDGNPSNGCETNITNNVNNCGNCNIVCPTRPNSTPTCVNGVCGFICTGSFRDCDGNPLNGCETNIATDVNNCGACGAPCPSGHPCVAGACQ